jgi:hypothetical protein
VMAGAVMEGGRVWLNTAVSVPTDPHPGGPHSGRGGKARVMLAHRWAGVLETAGLDLVDRWRGARPGVRGRRGVRGSRRRPPTCGAIGSRS